MTSHTSPRLETPIEIGELTLSNRLYRAPLLECAGEGPDAAERLRRELEPAAAAGVGLIFQGATPVRESGGRVAPNMTSVADPEFVSGLSDVTDAIHDHGTRIFAQLDHGGIRSLETWHAEYRKANPDRQQLAVSPLPAPFRLADALGALEYNTHVLEAHEIRDLARDFGRSGASLVDAGYDGIHLAGSNMGIIQQFLSPYYNHRDDEFGGSPDARFRFLALVYEEIRNRVGEGVPVMTKIPAETRSPAFARPRLSVTDGVQIARRAAEIGFDAVVPIEGSVLWDASLIRGAFPERAWNESSFVDGYADAFGSRLRARLVALVHRLHAHTKSFEPGWNADFCARVRDVVSIPVFCEGGLRERRQLDRLLGEGRCDLVGMGRPFYAEARLPARLLNSTAKSGGEDGESGVTDDTAVVCENCNNCTVPQATGVRGVCRTPSVLRERGELHRAGAYEDDMT